MIGQLTGILVEKRPTTILIDVNGLGYEAEISMNTYTQLPIEGEKVTLRTHLQIREDAHILYAFSTLSERSTYRQLIKVNGVGPRTALAILSTFTISQLSHIVQADDAQQLARVPGIGRKTAERLLIDLKDRFSNVLDHHQDNLKPNTVHEIHSALLALGYKESELQKLLRNLPNNISTEEGIRYALKTFSK